ncbi:MAG TPA: sigma-70 family RNA polymerase sigma factor, partial [Thermomicrobiales bacterium]
VSFALAYRLLGERGSAEDVVQEAFLRVWRQGATFNPERGSLRTWLLTIVHHRAIDTMRSKRSKMGADTAIDDALPLPAKEDMWMTISRIVERERIETALATLPTEQRQVVDLAYFNGLTYPEIAAQVGIPLGTVKSRMRMALEKLHDALQP